MSPQSFNAEREAERQQHEESYPEVLNLSYKITISLRKQEDCNVLEEKKWSLPQSLHHKTQPRHTLTTEQGNVSRLQIYR